uniref:Uncharacterized protein n=1 Tax=Candidatus Kentrum sp. FM TaxID=2126340 RepID=A0A450SHF5_9GAMM|nr:MAG: hypothetical protein BECKFM1743C_GA0114222_101113 [Candidatus Kentron sp. FM]VFK09372.1 MAG: hypothetical protein BECKFM1743B_GA0114221_101034 [Candidatus Kentron sp. FM]
MDYRRWPNDVFVPQGTGSLLDLGSTAGKWISAGIPENSRYMVFLLLNRESSRIAAR